MLVGLAGAHRAGKSTMARKFVEKYPAYKFVETSVGKIMQELGLDPKADCSFEERLDAQEKILNKLEELYSQHANGAVFDRTPLDAAAYLLADVQRGNIPADLNDRIVAYVQRCFDVTNRHFSLLLFVPSVITPVEEEGKAPATLGYIEHISMLINGLRTDQRCQVRSMQVPRAVIDIDDRVTSLRVASGHHWHEAVQEYQEARASGVPIH